MPEPRQDRLPHGVGGGEGEPPPRQPAEGPGAPPGLHGHPGHGGPDGPGPQPGHQRQHHAQGREVERLDERERRPGVGADRPHPPQEGGQKPTPKSQPTSAPQRTGRPRTARTSTARATGISDGETDRLEGQGEHDAADEGGEAAEHHGSRYPARPRPGPARLRCRGPAGGREARSPFGPTHDRPAAGSGKLSTEPAAPRIHPRGARPTSVNKRAQMLAPHPPPGHSDVGPPATICTGGPGNPVSPARACQHGPDLHERANSQVSAPRSEFPKTGEDISPGVSA